MIPRMTDLPTPRWYAKFVHWRSAETTTLVAAALALAVITAVATWVAERLIEARTHPLATAFSALFIMAVIWAFGAATLRQIRKDRGTLYYLRQHPATRVPLHDLTAVLSSEDADDFRAIRRSYAEPALGIRAVDVVDITDETFAEFERSTNEDDDDTLFEVAPDLDWPVALRIGFDWTPRRSVRMIELKPPAASAGEQHRPTEVYTRWMLKEPTSGPTFGEAPFSAVVNPAEFQEPIEAGTKIATVTPSTRIRLSLLATAVPTFTDSPDDPSDSRSRAPLLDEDRAYDATVVVYCTAPAGSISGQPEEDANPVSNYCARTVVLDGLRKIVLDPASTRSRLEEVTPDRADQTVLDGNHLADALAIHMIRVFEAFPEAQIDITARLPKTVAFALGCCLGRYAVPSSGRYPKLIDIWACGRLFSFQDPTQKYLPMLVHPAQRQVQPQGPD